MKRSISLLIILLTVLACKDELKFEPEGPTDIRVRNLETNAVFIDVIVNTSFDTNSLGTITAGGISDYVRFKKAFYRAEITALINDTLYSTGPVDYTGLNYIGQDKITYEVEITDTKTKTISITDWSRDVPIDDLK